MAQDSPTKTNAWTPTQAVIASEVLVLGAIAVYNLHIGRPLLALASLAAMLLIAGALLLIRHRKEAA